MDGIRKTAVLAVSLAFTSAHALPAHAAGGIHLLTSGFLKTSDERPNASSTILIDPKFEKSGDYVTAKVELQAMAYLNDHSSFTLEARDAYVATSRKLMPHHQFTTGRRHYDWSRADESWQLGIWSPRFNWDPFLPEQVGLTGGFYSYESRNWRLLAFASPISVPERGFPIRAENGMLVSSSAFWRPPVRTTPLMPSKEVPAYYSIATPPTEELIFNPGGAISLRFQSPDEGPSLGVSYGYLPIHQVDLAVEPQYSPTEQVLYATIHPRILMHHLLTTEAAFVDTQSSLWASLTLESPHAVATDPVWIANNVGNSVIAAVGGEIFRKERVGFSWSYLSIREDGGSTDQTEYVLPPRYAYNHAATLTLRGEITRQIGARVKLLRDLDWTENLVSADVDYRGRGWSAGLGADLLSTETGRGYLGQFEGDDRIRGSVSYAF